MKLFLFLAFAATAHADASISYIKTVWYDDWVADTSGVTGLDCTGEINRTLLVRVPPTEYTGTKASLWNKDLQGACFTTSNVGKMHITGMAQSYAFSELAATPGKIHILYYATADCEGAAVLQQSGFTFDMANTNPKSCANSHSGGNVTCGLCLNNACGLVTAQDNSTVNTGDGCNDAVVADNNNNVPVEADSAGWEVQGAFFHAVRALAMHIQGPFEDLGCKQTTNNWSDSYPMVIPLVDLVANDTTLNETAVSSTGLCYDYGFEGNANAPTAVTGDVNLWQVSTTADKGKMQFIYSSGTDSDYVTRTSCTAGSGAYAKFYWDVGITGSYEYCTRAVTSAGAVTSAWYKIQPYYGTLGDGLNMKDYQTSCPSTTDSPASSLNVSILMAVIIAVVAAIM